MRWTSFYIPTLKEAPADAEVISHKLLTRSGMIRKLSSGIYSYLPLGLKALNNIAQIVREEMESTGSNEVLLPAMQPADLWKESGRWEQYGKELVRLQDRHNREYCLGPTHEEVITDLLRKEVRSYRQLPVSMYQIQTKFRDEIRPRFGLMRGREFVMKDAYTFDKDDEGADKSYWGMYNAYKRVFSRLGLDFRPVEADSGSIGGNFSHEFMVLAQTGEDTVIACSSCEYAANQERASAQVEQRDAYTKDIDAYSEVHTPQQHTVEEICRFLSVQADEILKTLLLDVDGKAVAVLIRGDRELNEIKVKNHFNAQEVTLASPLQVEEWTKAPLGFAGPVGLNNITILADLELESKRPWVTGANKADTHLINVVLERDTKISAYLDLHKTVAGELCPHCSSPLTNLRGIEVGHVFKLGTKYSSAMQAMFLDEKGEEHPIIMGCYGIGVSRVLAACVEQNHDDKGIIFPPAIAPVELVLSCLDTQLAELMQKAEELYAAIKKLGISVLLDDREERPGVKFNDADLIGAPLQVILGAKNFAQDLIEVKDRKSGEKKLLRLSNFMEEFVAWKDSIYANWKK